MKTTLIFVFIFFSIAIESNAQDVDVKMDECEFWISLDDQFSTQNSQYHEYVERKLPYIIEDYHNTIMENGKPLKFYRFNWYVCVNVAHVNYIQYGNREKSIARFYKHLNREKDLGLTINEDFLFDLITSKIMEEKFQIFISHNKRVYDLMLNQLLTKGYPTHGNTLCKNAAANVFYHYAKREELQILLQELKDNNRITKEDLFLANANLLK